MIARDLRRSGQFQFRFQEGLGKIPVNHIYSEIQEGEQQLAPLFFQYTGEVPWITKSHGLPSQGEWGWGQSEACKGSS